MGPSAALVILICVRFLSPQLEHTTTDAHWLVEEGNGSENYGSAHRSASVFFCLCLFAHSRSQWPRSALLYLACSSSPPPPKVIIGDDSSLMIIRVGVRGTAGQHAPLLGPLRQGACAHDRRSIAATTLNELSIANVSSRLVLACGLPPVSNAVDQFVPSEQYRLEPEHDRLGRLRDESSKTVRPFANSRRVR